MALVELIHSSVAFIVGRTRPTYGVCRGQQAQPLSVKFTILHIAVLGTCSKRLNPSFPKSVGKGENLGSFNPSTTDPEERI